MTLKPKILAATFKLDYNPTRATNRYETLKKLAVPKHLIVGDLTLV